MVIVFDLNGTLLDTTALKPLFRSIFGTKLSVEEWYAKVLGHSTALTLAGEYRDFGNIATAVLKMAASGLGVELSAKQVEKVQNAMLELPRFSDVKGGLIRLNKAGYRLAVLTNSAPMSLAKQLANAGLNDFFERALSIEVTGKYKPAPETYEYAAQSLGVQTSDILMVAAHLWDLLGASRAGCRTAFLKRPGRALLPGANTPHYVAKDLRDLANQISRNPQAASQGSSSQKVIPLMVAGSVLALGLVGNALASRPPQQT